MLAGGNLNSEQTPWAAGSCISRKNPPTSTKCQHFCQPFRSRTTHIPSPVLPTNRDKPSDLPTIHPTISYRKNCRGHVILSHQTHIRPYYVTLPRWDRPFYYPFCPIFLNNKSIRITLFCPSKRTSNLSHKLVDPLNHDSMLRRPSVLELPVLPTLRGKSVRTTTRSTLYCRTKHTSDSKKYLNYAYQTISYENTIGITSYCHSKRTSTQKQPYFQQTHFLPK